MWKFPKGWLSAPACLLVLMLTPYAGAHFVWLDCDNSGESTAALLFFGEGPHDRDYHLPDSLSEATIQIRTADGTQRNLDAEYHETDDFVGLRAAVDADDDFALQGVCQYGIYHGTLLTYCPKYLHCESQADWSEFKSSDSLPLEILPVASADGIECTVLHEGEPLADAKVTLTDGGERPVVQTTDQQGKAMFYLAQDGHYGLLANFTDKENQGELDGEEYTSATLYATLHVDYVAGESAETAAAAKPAQSSEVDYPELPEPVASFGAAVVDGWLYVYSGHIGRAHQHSSENLSQQFIRLNLDGGSEWEELPMQTPLQGHALVAHGGYLYRVGGMNARNAADEDDDLHSVAEFARFDPEAKTWQALPDLPEPRSSHDAVVMNGQLYVVGGWVLEGPGHGDWLYTCWSFDLSDPQAEWQPLPEPPFARRALAAAHWQGKVAVVCGMDDESDVTRRVDFCDPETGEWTEGPELPGEGIHGFGVSAWNLNGKLYASGLSGHLYQLADDGTAWNKVAQLDIARFFHRLLPSGDGAILAVAGASFEQGHLDSIERIELPTTKVADARQ